MNFVRNPVLFLRGNIRLHLPLHIEPAKNNAAETHIKFSLPTDQFLETILPIRIVFLHRRTHDEEAVPTAALKRKEFKEATVDSKRSFLTAHCGRAGHQLLPLLFRHTSDDNLAYHLFFVASYQHTAFRRDTR